MSARIVRATFQATGWSGWSPKHGPITRSAQITANEREAFCPESFDPARVATADLDRLRYSIWPVRIWDHKAIFHYDRLVIETTDEGYSMFGGPYQGDIVLRIGQHIRFATPTMDGGVVVFFRLDAIEPAPPHEAI